MEKDHRLIDQYLAGDMEETQRKAFEERLSNESNLRRRLRLRKELEGYLGSEEPAVEDFLQRTADSYHQERGKQPTSRWWWALMLLVLLGFIIASQIRPTAQPETPRPQRPPTTQQPQEDIRVQPPAAVPEQTEPPPTAPSVPMPAPASAPQSPDTEQPPATVTYAALNATDFAPNPLLEDLTRTTLRSTDSSSLHLVNFTGDTLRSNALGELEVAGFSTRASAFELALYDNLEANFINEQPVYRSHLRGNATASGWAFGTKVPLPVRPGRYYLLLLDEEGELLSAKVFLSR